ncbi:MAG: uracil-DNA glycosylase [Candidatus Kapabacteria bacterium]|nr:uracil-DNA glycosylase [Candidatus Kapabacteria bacterium]
MNENIIDKVISYFEFQKESFGKNLLVELPDYIPEQLSIIPSQKENKELPKLEKTKIETPVVPQEEPTISPDWDKSKTLDELYSKIHNCKECQLGISRKSFVFGSGNPNADILVIGEAPGADEDEQGLPFIGRAGQLLTKILESINLSREEVYIANIVKCRPPNNRRPEKNEVDCCEPYLKKQIELINPAFILSLGLTSIDTLLKKTHKMADIRGNLMDYYGRKMLVTYHPAALLRNPQWKKFVWEDVKLLRSLYDEFLANK